MEDFGLGEAVTVTKQIDVAVFRLGKYATATELGAAPLVKPVVSFRLDHQLFSFLAGRRCA
jgi:hypothetical protein